MLLRDRIVLVFEWASWSHSLLVYELVQMRELLMAALLAVLMVLMWVESRESKMVCSLVVQKVQRWVWWRVDKLVGQ